MLKVVHVLFCQKLDSVEPCEDTAKGYFNAGKLFMQMLSHQKYLSNDAFRIMKKQSMDNYLLVSIKNNTMCNGANSIKVVIHQLHKLLWHFRHKTTYYLSCDSCFRNLNAYLYSICKLDLSSNLN